MHPSMTVTDARTPVETRARTGHRLGMSPAAFLRDYWQKRPLLVRGAFPDFRNPIAPDDLAGLACEEMALSRIVIENTKESRVRRKGSRRSHGPGSPWELRTGPFAEGDFAKLPKKHWTLLVQDVDKWDADVATLLDAFAFLPGWRIDDIMVSYAEEGGSVGAHVDQYDVFLLQGLGRRRWRIDAGRFRGTRKREHAGSGEHFAWRDDTELRILREFAPTHDWVLEPGDLLYLPPDVPHHGIAIGGACMTYSVGMRAPSKAELRLDLAAMLAERLPESARYADPDLEPARHPGEIDAAALQRVRAALAPFDAVDDATLVDWFGRFITRYRAAHEAVPPARRPSAKMLERRLAAGARLHRNPHSRCAWHGAGRLATLFVAGQAWRCSASLARLVCSSRAITLPRNPAEADRRTLLDLIDAGHVAITAERRTAG
jgi:50S ribosomal protein L16 3-hydroxylase